MKKNKLIPFIPLGILIVLITAYGFITNFIDTKNVIDIIPELVPLTESPAMFYLPTSEASGISVKSNAKAVIDYSNTKDGYVMVKFLREMEKAVKVIIEGPSGVSYTYGLKPNGEYEVFPLSDGSGKYRIAVYENTNGTKYASVISVSEQVVLNDEFAPFIRPNQYVNYNKESEAVRLAAELTQSGDSLLKKVSSVYQYIIENIKYDKELAVTVQSGYIPDVDEILKKGKGICFDYASVMTAMLRSQMIPTKLVVGYTGGVNHAWISVYSEETGWIDNVIYFDGLEWRLIDPTLAAGKAAKDDIKNFVGDGKNYLAKYLY